MVSCPPFPHALAPTPAGGDARSARAMANGHYPPNTATTPTTTTTRHTSNIGNAVLFVVYFFPEGTNGWGGFPCGESRNPGERDRPCVDPPRPPTLVCTKPIRDEGGSWRRWKGERSRSLARSNRGISAHHKGGPRCAFQPPPLSLSSQRLAFCHLWLLYFY